MNRYFIFLFIIFIRVLPMHAQDTVLKSEKNKDAQQKEIKPDKPNPVQTNMVEEIGEAGKGQYTKGDDALKQTKSGVQSAVKKLEKKTAGAKSDTTSHKQNGIFKEVKKDLKSEKDKMASGLKAVKTNVKSSANQAKKPKANKKAVTGLETAKEKKVDTAKESIKNVKLQKPDDDVKNESKNIKSNVKQEAGEVKNAIPDTTDLKTISQQVHRKMLEDKISQMQYSSDDPNNAPWKKTLFSKDDLNDIKIPSTVKDFSISKDGSLKKYEDKLKSNKVSDISKLKTSTATKALKANKLTHIEDSVSRLRDELNIDNGKQRLSGAKKIYSDKYIKKLYDSLGGGKVDSMLKIASPFVKTEASEQELLSRINSSIAGKKLEDDKHDAAVKDADKIQNIEKDYRNTDLSGLKKGDLSDLKLPQSVLSELPPLSGMELDAKYLRVVDSMKNVTLKAKGYVMEDKKITDKVKQSALKRRPTFISKTYFDGIIGFVRDTTVTIYKFSPALGYHFSNFLSAGLGPNFLVQLQGKKIDLQTGLRPFIKGEIWKQRAYLQVEDNIKTSKFNSELGNNKIIHEVLGGGGVILAISGSLGINIQLLYRLNKLAGSPNQSPWVFRVGLSSIKKLK